MPDETNTEQSAMPKPEVLKTQEDSLTPSTISEEDGSTKVSKLWKRSRTAYKPTHKATFIGLAVVALILAVNGVVIAMLLRDKTSAASIAENQVTLSNTTLDKLGVNRKPTGNDKTELIVGPNSRFKGSIEVGGGMSVGGTLTLNSKLSAGDASLAKLQAGDTSLNTLNVNGDATAGTLNLRKDLLVAGLSRFQGPITATQLVTVNNNLNVTGNLAIGGALSVRSLQVSALVSDTTLTIGGHIITRGSAPSTSPGGGLGASGTTSVSGNDASGTVALNVGAGSPGGELARVTFSSKYSETPHIVLTPVGRAIPDIYINRDSSGFSILSASPLAPGGYAVDYVVMQ